MATLHKRIEVFSDGSYKIEFPSSPKLYQFRDDYAMWGKPRDCAYGGCPGVMLLIDEADTEFNMDWQYYLVAINPGMRLNNISELMGITKALMNKTGVGGEYGRRDYIRNENLSSDKNPRLDKLRTFGLNTHEGWDDGTYVYLRTMNGNRPPPMKFNPDTRLPYPRPQSLSQINRNHYLYLPETHRQLFLDCNNVQWMQETKSLDYGSYDNGVGLSWTGDERLHSFFPFVSEKELVKSPLRLWKKIAAGEPFPSPFRSG